MQMPSDSWSECVSGLGASGLHLLLAWRGRGMPAPSGHPMVPMLTIALLEEEEEEEEEQQQDQEEGRRRSVVDATYADVRLPRNAGAVEWCRLVLERIQSLASGEYVPLAFANANVDFQIARGSAISL